MCSTRGREFFLIFVVLVRKSLGSEGLCLHVCERLLGMFECKTVGVQRLFLSNRLAGLQFLFLQKWPGLWVCFWDENGRGFWFREPESKIEDGRGLKGF